MTSQQDYLTLKEAANHSGRTTTALNDAYKKGKLGMYNIIGKGWCLDRREVEDYAAHSARRSDAARAAWSGRGTERQPLFSETPVAVAQPAPETPSVPWDKENTATPINFKPVTGMIWVKDNARGEHVLVKAEEFNGENVCEVHGRAAMGLNVTAYKVTLYPTYTGGDYRVYFLPYGITKEQGLPNFLFAILCQDILARNLRTVSQEAGQILLD